jgi:mannose-6-phosphate isomerase-like protein (cupin superfamily)
MSGLAIGFGRFMDPIETVSDDAKLYCYIIRSSVSPAKTTFITPSDATQQVGFIVYPRGGQVPRHVHKPAERHVRGTPEVLLVRSGRCEVDIYNDEQRVIATRPLGPGDVVVLVAGGHGLRMLEDTVFLEVKQGPYLGSDDKVLF